jgi:hypothetical protein
MKTSVESPNIRISARAKATLRTLAKQEGRSMQAVLDLAIERYERERFMEEANAGYARLRANPQAWQEELEERKEWDATDSDGTPG